MILAIVGAGQVGSTFAYQLARAGHDVTVVARPNSPRLAQLRRDNGIVVKTGEHAGVRVADALDEHVGYDVVIVTTLAHQAEPLLPAFARSRAACIHFMSVNFNPERFGHAVGTERCTFGMPFVMALLDADGKLSPTITTRQKTLHGDRRWVDLFNAASIPSAFEPDMPLWLRCHVPLSIAFESIAVSGQRRGTGASWSEAMLVARGLHAGFAIVRGLGDRLYPRAKSVIDALPVPLVAFLMWTFARIPSARELLATGRNECRALVDAMAASAADAHPAMPAELRAVLAIKPG